MVQRDGQSSMTFLLTMIFMFLTFFRPQEWLLPWLFGVPVLDIVVFLSLLFLMIETRNGHVTSVKGSPQVFLFIGLWLSTLMSHIANTNFAGLMLVLPESFKVCLFGLLFFVVLDRPSRLRTAIRVFVLMAIVMAVHALLQDSRGYGFAGQLPMRGWRIVEGENVMVRRTIFYGVFHDPNDLAQMLVTCMPFVLLFFKRRFWLQLLPAIGVIWLLQQANVTTESRGGTLAFIGACACGGLFLVPVRAYPFVVGLILIAILAACPFALKIPGFSTAIADRVILWGDANAAFKQYPFFGIGFGRITEFTFNSHVAHNSFAECYAELGIFGYWFWFLLIQLGVVGTVRVRAALRGVKDPEAVWLRRFTGFGLAGMVGYVVSSYFLSRAHVYPTVFLMAMFGAVPRMAKPWLREDQMPILNMHRDVLLLGTLGAIGSVGFIYASIRLIGLGM